jgi:nucleoside-triphosphatase THEP1
MYFNIVQPLDRFMVTEHMPEPNIVLLTGQRQIGKSMLCRKLVDCLLDNGYQVKGLLTRRTGSHDLEVTEIHTAQTYPLTLPFNPGADRLIGNFLFSPESFHRSNRALEVSFPTQVFFLDELGPLELTHHKGWVKVIQMLAEEVYGIAFVVVRPELLAQAIDAFPATVYTVVCVREDNRDGLLDTLYHMVLQLDENTSTGVE